MSDLPPGWEWTTLGDIAESVKNGIYISRPGTTPDGVPILRINAVRPAELRLDEIRYSGKGIENLQSEGALLEPGDLLFTRYSGSRDYVGVCAITPDNVGPLTYPDKLIRVRLKEVEPRYVMFAFSGPLVRSVVESSLRTTAGQVGISGANLKAVRIPIAPLAEQRRIISALERYLTRVQSAVTSLRAACMKVDLLVATARQEITMAFAGGMRPLGDLLVGVEAGRSFVAEGRPAESDEWGIIKVSAMTWGEFRQDENKAVPCDREIDIRHEIKPGDILVSRANTENYVGAAVLVRDTRPKLLLSDKSLRLIPKQSVDPIWLAEVLASPAVRSQISARATGMKDSMRNISQKALREIRVPRATPQQQAGAVEVLSGLRVETLRLRSQVYAAERRQDLLHASLLRDAFSGRLMRQDPNDEPASVLLERIKAEQATQLRFKRARRTAKNADPEQESML